MAAVTAIVLPPVFGGASDVWGRFIFDYQTLITGLAAVSAATWTISVMKKTDDRQETRHRELIELSLRSDRLKLERALNPQIVEMSMFAERMDRLKSDTLKRNTLAGQEQFLEENLWQIGSINSDLRALLEREAFKDGEKLFDGAATYRVAQLRELAANAAVHIDHADRVLNPFPDKISPLPREALIFERQHIYYYVMNVSQALREACMMLARIGSRYGIAEFSHNPSPTSEPDQL